MSWYWYVSRLDELMLDIDSRAPGGSLLGPTRRRLRAAVEAKIFDVRDVHVFPSAQPEHLHVIVRVWPIIGHEPIDQTTEERVFMFTWEMQLRSDVYRGRCNIARALDGLPAPGLLISPARWEPFYRDPDFECECPSKHTIDVMRDCPAAKAARGESRCWEPFGHLSKSKMVPALYGKPGPVNVGDFLETENADSV